MSTLKSEQQQCSIKENDFIITALNALKEELPIDWKREPLKTWVSTTRKTHFMIF